VFGYAEARHSSASAVLAALTVALYRLLLADLSMRLPKR
jgi:hypothetical protein